ncbi:hypothetical protein M9H77_34713 [Catharanthus roseus]|uniref:Uncharacterized protein n=1 Tax=Catharanthus roseus TaxID=4058 RepID=A0ACB9ZM87_CATRO|nr:hypothetical protein M9H77_34713 [Catharanthus roseus]
MDKHFEKGKKGSKLIEETSSKKPLVGVEFSDCEIIGDPGLRKPIDSYSYKIRDELRRRYSKNSTWRAHIGFSLLIVLIGYLKILIKILSFNRGIYPNNFIPKKKKKSILSNISSTQWNEKKISVPF